jgi:hypothetical protein
MSNDKQGQVPIAPRQGSVRNQEFRDIYSNNTRIGISPFDFSLTFSTIVEPTAGMTVIEDQVVVRMSAQQFKAFLDSASKTMTAWEEVFGSVQLTIPERSVEQITAGIRKLKEAVDKSII